MDISSRNLKAYLKLRAEAQALREAMHDVDGQAVAAHRKLTGGQIAEATRLLQSNPYCALVRVKVYTKMPAATKLQPAYDEGGQG